MEVKRERSDKVVTWVARLMGHKIQIRHDPLKVRDDDVRAV